jgi:inosose dehydratase
MRTSRIAAAPISWGVCEVPGWGYQLSSPRVLSEMRELWLTATELGPDGFLPPDPVEVSRVLANYDLTAAAGFTPVLLHVATIDPVPDVEQILDGLADTGADVLALFAVTGRDGYDTRSALDAEGWERLLSNLDRLDAAARERGIRAVLHPHVGTMIQTGDEVQRILHGSSIALCIDTGHLLIGGTDPADLARQVPDRIAHTHLKDVDIRLAGLVRSGERSYTEAVREGMYRPLGAGDVDIAATVEHLERAGYRGWYTLEQDIMLTEEPAGEGPVADVRESLRFITDLLAALHTTQSLER